MDATVGITVGKTRHHGRTADIAGQGRQATLGDLRRAVGHKVFFRSARSIAGERDHDDVGLDAAQNVIAHPKFFHHPGGKIIHYDIAL